MTRVRFALCASIALLVLLLGPGAGWAGPVLAVAPFENHSADPAFAPLGRGLADMLITDLGQVSSLTVVERSRLQSIHDELALQQSAWADPKTAARVGAGVGASWILVGSLVSVEPILRIDARVLDVATGAVRTSRAVSGPKSDFFLLEKELAQGLLADLDLSATAREQAALGRVATESFDALLAYSAGLEALDRGAIEEAKARLEAALSADERFARAASALEDLSARLQKLDRQRAAAQDDKLRSLLQRIDDLQGKGGPYDTLQTELVTAMSAASSPKEARVALALTGRLLDLKLPEDLRIGGATGVLGLNEWALCSHAMALHWLGRWADFLGYGEACLSRYPAGTWAPAVQPMMQRVVAELKKAEEGRKQLSRVRGEAMLEMWKTRCRGELRPAERLAACQRWLADATTLELPIDDDTHEVFGRAAQHAGDRAALVARLEAVRRADRYAVSVGALEGLLQRLDRDLADVAEHATLDPAAASAEDLADAAGDLADVGREAEAHRLLEGALQRFPAADSLHRARVDLCVRFGRWARGDEAVRMWESAEGLGAQVDPGRARAVRDGPSNGRWVEEAEGLALLMYAHRARDLGLYREAGDTYLEVARRFPEMQASAAPSSIQLAGHAFYAGGLADAARGAFELLLQRWPESGEATAARSMLEILPR